MLTGADEVEVLALDLVHHGVHLREGHDALHHVAVHHEGRDDIGETLVDHEVAGIGQNSLVQAGDVAQQIVEAIAGHAACGVHINAVEALHDLGVVRDGEIRHDRLTEALSLDVVGVVRADGYAGVDHLGDGVHDLLNAFSQLCLLGFQLCHLVGVSLDSGVVGVDLSLQLSLLGLVAALLQLAEQRAVGLAQLVAGSLQGLDFLQALAVLGVLLDDFVNEGELCILKLLLDVFLDRIRVVADKFDVKHDNSPYTLLLAQGGVPRCAVQRRCSPPWYAFLITFPLRFSYQESCRATARLRGLLHIILPQQICKGFQLIVRIEMDGQLSLAVVVGHADFAAQRLLEAFFHLHRQRARQRRGHRLFCGLCQLFAQSFGLTDVQLVVRYHLSRFLLQLRRRQAQNDLRVSDRNEAAFQQLQHCFRQAQQPQAVGQCAANIRKLRAPEPYKGKGIKYADEHILRKAGKAGK